MHETEQFKEQWAGKADIISVQTYIPTRLEFEREDYLAPEKDTPAVNKEKMCTPLRQRMTIRANGDVMACCNFRNILKVGNVKEEPVYDIWNGKKMENLRVLHLNGQYKKIPLCKDCLST